MNSGEYLKNVFYFKKKNKVWINLNGAKNNYPIKFHSLVQDGFKYSHS